MARASIIIELADGPEGLVPTVTLNEVDVTARIVKLDTGWDTAGRLVGLALELTDAPATG